MNGLSVFAGTATGGQKGGGRGTSLGANKTEPFPAPTHYVRSFEGFRGKRGDHSPHITHHERRDPTTLPAIMKKSKVRFGGCLSTRTEGPTRIAAKRLDPTLTIATLSLSLSVYLSAISAPPRKRAPRPRQLEDPTLERSFRGHKDTVSSVVLTQPASSHLGLPDDPSCCELQAPAPGLQVRRAQGRCVLARLSRHRPARPGSKDRTVRLWLPLWRASHPDQGPLAPSGPQASQDAVPAHSFDDKTVKTGRQASSSARSPGTPTG